jgi:hypothetical protein
VEALLSAGNLSKHHKEVVALDNISFGIYEDREESPRQLPQSRWNLATGS